MQIKVPRTEHPAVRIMVAGINVNVSRESHQYVDVELPEGVCEKSVEISYVGLDNARKPVGPVLVLQAATPSEPPAQPESEQPAEPETPTELSLDWPPKVDESEIVSPFKGGVEKKGGPFKGPKAKGL